MGMSTSPAPIAIVTGGSRGIGKSIALKLAERGVDILLTYRERADEARATVTEIEAKGRRGFALPLDLGRTATFAAFVETVERALEGRPLDYLVNNAGTGDAASFTEVSETDLDALLAVHFKGPFFLTQKLLPLMADGGAIVNVTSRPTILRNRLPDT